MTDKDYMNLAIEISKKAYYPYGAVIVKDNKIIGRSDSNTPVSKSEYAHAELKAIEDCIDELGGHLCAEGGSGKGIYVSQAYVTKEHRREGLLKMLLEELEKNDVMLASLDRLKFKKFELLTFYRKIGKN